MDLLLKIVVYAVPVIIAITLHAKPVPVNFAALRSPKRDMIWVAAAGPGMNILLAMISAGLLGLVSRSSSTPQF
jgi:uncharacterized protein YybS (DUF2232 family)